MCDAKVSVFLREMAQVRASNAFGGVFVGFFVAHVFGLEKEYMLCAPDAKEGQFFLDEIMHTGNFGQGDRRYKGYGKMRRMAKHGMHLLIHYPSEVLWTPVWLVYHKVWKYRRIKRIII